MKTNNIFLIIYLISIFYCFIICFIEYTFNKYFKGAIDSVTKKNKFPVLGFLLMAIVPFFNTMNGILFTIDFIKTKYDKIYVEKFWKEVVTRK
jgi:hypothetical protein